MVKIYKQPFAHDGDTIAIPDVSQPDGKMSSADGWTVDYQLPSADPNYKPVDRQEMNGVFKEVTEALGQIQQFGFADWQNTVGGWPIGASVRHADGYWQSLANGNTEEPGTGALWKELLFGNLVPASETIRGVIQLATEAQAQELTAGDVAITPETLSEAFKGGNQSLGNSGFQRLPGGLILQWGNVSVSGNTPTLVTFPTAFPTNALCVVATDVTTTPIAADDNIWIPIIRRTSRTQFQMMIRELGGSSSTVGNAVNYIAIGI